MSGYVRAGNVFDIALWKDDDGDFWLGGYLEDGELQGTAVWLTCSKALMTAATVAKLPTPPPPPAPEAKTGSTVFTHHSGEVHHPEANVFDTDEHNNLFLLDNDTNEGQVALYAAGTWHHAISHGTHPNLEDE